MAINQQQMDNAISQGLTDGTTRMDNVQKAYTKPYDNTRATAGWYKVLESMFPGTPGKMVEEMLIKADKAKYAELKEKFIEALAAGGKKNE
jgi:hypothetical protein